MMYRKETYRHIAEQIVKVQCESGGCERNSYDVTIDEDHTYCRYIANVDYDELDGYRAEIKISVQFQKSAKDDVTNIFVDVYDCPGDQCMSLYTLKEDPDLYKVLDIETGEILLKGDITL